MLNFDNSNGFHFRFLSMKLNISNIAYSSATYIFHFGTWLVWTVESTPFSSSLFIWTICDGYRLWSTFSFGTGEDSLVTELLDMRAYIVHPLINWLDNGLVSSAFITELVGSAHNLSLYSMARYKGRWANCNHVSSLRFYRNGPCF